MANKKVTQIVSEILTDFLNSNGLELYNVEFQKEGKDWFLRVYIDKAWNIGDEPTDEYISTDDCEMVSRFLSAKLDEIDPIEQNYYLEVSSPGMERTLISPKDFVRFKGSMVDISLYKALDGQKTYTGELFELDNDGNIIILQADKQIKFTKEQVAKVSLAIVF